MQKYALRRSILLKSFLFPRYMWNRLNAVRVFVWNSNIIWHSVVSTRPPFSILFFNQTQWTDPWAIESATNNTLHHVLELLYCNMILVRRHLPRPSGNRRFSGDNMSCDLLTFRAMARSDGWVMPSNFSKSCLICGFIAILIVRTLICLDFLKTAVDVSLVTLSMTLDRRRLLILCSVLKNVLRL